MNIRSMFPESKEREEKVLPVQPVSQLKIEDIFVRFLQKPEINQDRSYVTLVKLKQDFIKFIKAQQNKDVKLDMLYEDFCKQLTNAITKNISHLYSVTIDAVSFYDVMLTLVRLCPPINPTDPFTLYEIKPENQVRISDGHQFDVESLYQWIQSTRLESLANPLTGVKLIEQDKQTILKAVKRYTEREGKEFKILQGNAHLHGDPDFDATMELARELDPSQSIIPQQMGNESERLRRIDALFSIPFFSRILIYSPSDNRIYQSRNSMRETVTALSSYGMTQEILSAWHSVDGDPFTVVQKEILIYLVTGQPRESLVGITQPEPPLSVEQRLTPEQAVREIDLLWQDQIKALFENYAYGLRGNHLRQWQAPPDNPRFTLCHAAALKILFREGHFSPEEAMERINGKTESEAIDIFRFYIEDQSSRFGARFG